MTTSQKRARVMDAGESPLPRVTREIVEFCQRHPIRALDRAGFAPEWVERPGNGAGGGLAVDVDPAQASRAIDACAIGTAKHPLIRECDFDAADHGADLFPESGNMVDCSRLQISISATTCASAASSARAPIHHINMVV